MMRSWLIWSPLLRRTLTSYTSACLGSNTTVMVALSPGCRLPVNCSMEKGPPAVQVKATAASPALRSGKVRCRLSATATVPNWRAGGAWCRQAEHKT